jgi:ATP-dependent Clp protease ATP-binding subunit ClpB
VGYEEGGQLTESVRRRPYSVVLFDEIEKAHPEVFNSLLQILDDGRMTDGHGRTVDFKNTIIIMTSNVGSHWIQELGADDRDEMEKRVMDALRSSFNPEFLNRIDDIMIFHNLTAEHLKSIVDIQLQRVRERLRDRHITLELSEDAKTLLARDGFDPTYGARPLKRAIQKHVENPLAMEMLQGRYGDGAHIVASVRDGKIVFGEQ